MTHLFVNGHGTALGIFLHLLGWIEYKILVCEKSDGVRFYLIVVTDKANSFVKYISLIKVGVKSAGVMKVLRQVSMKFPPLKVLVNDSGLG